MGKGWQAVTVLASPFVMRCAMGGERRRIHAGTTEDAEKDFCDNGESEHAVDYRRLCPEDIPQNTTCESLLFPKTSPSSLPKWEKEGGVL